jgi:hypothetical protein
MISQILFYLLSSLLFPSSFFTSSFLPLPLLPPILLFLRHMYVSLSSGIHNTVGCIHLRLVRIHNEIIEDITTSINSLWRTKSSENRERSEKRKQNGQEINSRRLGLETNLNIDFLLSDFNNKKMPSPLQFQVFVHLIIVCSTPRLDTHTT